MKPIASGQILFYPVPPRAHIPAESGVCDKIYLSPEKITACLFFSLSVCVTCSIPSTFRAKKIDPFYRQAGLLWTRYISPLQLGYSWCGLEGDFSPYLGIGAADGYSRSMNEATLLSKVKMSLGLIKWNRMNSV